MWILTLGVAWTEQAEWMVIPRVVHHVLHMRCQGRGREDLCDVLSAPDAILDANGVEEVGSDEVPTGSVDGTEMEEVRGVGDVVHDSLDKLDR